MEEDIFDLEQSISVKENRIDSSCLGEEVFSLKIDNLLKNFSTEKIKELENFFKSNFSNTFLLDDDLFLRSCLEQILKESSKGFPFLRLTESMVRYDAGSYFDYIKVEGFNDFNSIDGGIIIDSDFNILNN